MDRPTLHSTAKEPVPGANRDDGVQGSDLGAPDADLDLPVIESIRGLGAGIVLIFSCFITYYALSLNLRHHPFLLSCDAASLLVVIAIVVSAGRGGLAARHSHAAGAAMIAIVALNITLSAIVRGGAEDRGYIPFLLILIGAVFLSTAWTLASFAFVSILIATLYSQIPGAEEAINFLMSCLVGTSLMAAIFLSRKRLHRGLIRLRSSDKELNRSLRQALERSELRLLEQQRIEARRQELEDQLRQSQKLEAVGVLAGGVAHDMNNVLGAITTVASLAAETAAEGSSLRADLTDILAAARRGSALTRNLLGFARQGTKIKERFRVETTIESIAHLLRRTISKQVELEVEAHEGLDDIVGDPGQLSHVIMNLCINSVDAMQGQGTIRIAVVNITVANPLALKLDIPQGRYIEVSVADNGCGIAPDILGRVFEPFFTTKSQSERSGLGLSMVYGTVREHGGAVTIESVVGQGTTIRLLLPSQPRMPASVAPPSVRAEHAPELRRTILLVDDEPLLRSAGRRIILALGFEALVAANGAEAVAVFRRHREEVGLVILDVAMPVMGGKDCFLRLRELDPTIPVLVASGFAKQGGVDDLLSSGATGYLAKPYDLTQMGSAIHHCLSRSGTLPVAVSNFPTSGDMPSQAIVK